MKTLVDAVHSSLAAPRSRLRLPLRPRFLNEMTVIPLPSGVFIDGADEPHILEGEGARKLFSQLLPLMDGSRTTQQIRQELPGVPATDLHAALSDLLRWGLVEDAETS